MNNYSNYSVVPEDKLVPFIEKAYELSEPKGMGFLHFREGGLGPGEAQQWVNRFGGQGINLDYVNGRAVKLTLFRERETGLYYVDPRNWYDHTPAQLAGLLAVLK